MDKYVGILRVNRRHILREGGTILIRAVFYLGPAFGFTPILFGPENVDFDKNTIDGQVFKNGKLEDITVSIPPVIDNSPLDSRYADFMKKMNERTHMIRQKLGTTKQMVYDMLSKEGSFKHILIPTEPISSLSQVVNELDKNDIIIKHRSGSGGRSIHKLSKDGDHYQMIKGNDKVRLNEEEVGMFLNEKIEDGGWIMQPFVTSTSKFGEPFDIRIHCKRGAGGKFVTRAFPRVGSAKGVVSNISSGGYTMPLEAFLQRNFGEEGAEEILAKIKNLGDTFPEYYDKFFKSELFDVGIDIGIDKERNLNLFEVNTYVGPLGFEIDDAINCFGYYNHLYDKLGLNQGIN